MNRRGAKPIRPVYCLLRTRDGSFAVGAFVGASVHRARIDVSSAEMQDWLSAIAAKASTLQERLGPEFEVVPGDGSAELIHARMQAWLAAAARGDHNAFQRRLSWDGLDERAAQRAVAPVRLRRGALLPAWTTTLAEVARLTGCCPAEDRCIDREDAVAFEDLLIPFVVTARSTCKSQADRAYATFTPAAHQALEHSLLKLLSGIAARTLLVEFVADMADEDSALDLLADTAPRRERYKDFVARMRSGGLIGFFQEYAGLARMLANTVTLWASATSELLQRFCRDRESICHAFGIHDHPTVAAFEPCSSDPHHGLRAVAMLRLESGERIIYKPRTIRDEALWNELLELCNHLGAPIDFRSYRVLEYGDYGWTEYVPGAPCHDAKEVRRYVTRAGALLALVYLLGGTDCHADNIIPAGEYPVLIDVETMLAPKPVDCSARTDAVRAAHKLLWESALSSYLLPRWSRGLNDDEVIDASAFGAIPGEAAVFGPRWADVNTDRMRLVRFVPPRERNPAASTDAGLPRAVSQREGELVTGFQAMYKFLASHRDQLLLPASPFQQLRGATVRFVYRNTAIYAAVLDRLTTPRYFRDGAERSIEIEELAYGALAAERCDGRPGWAEIWRSEREAVERGDVPHFTATPGGLSLNSGSREVVPSWFPERSHDLALDRLDSLSDVDLGLQVDLIRSAIRSRSASSEARSSAISGLPCGPDDPQAWLAEAVAIARSLAEQAIRGADGSVCWIQRVWSRELPADPPVAELQVTENDLYNGGPGIALFFAAVERVAPGNGLLPYALGAIQPLIADLSNSGDDVAEQIGLGGLCGIGSAVYALTCMSELLGRSDLMQQAERAAELISEKRIDGDVACDVTLGSAGALLALLALNEANGSPFALARARYCGQRVLAQFEDAGNDVRAIRTLEGRFLTGFSHGAAGIAYALCRLYAVTGEAPFLKGAQDLMSFERAAYSQHDDNWLDLRHPGSPRSMSSWCHGAPGIGLARIGSPDIVDQEETRREIDRALAISQENAIGGGDCLCCGTFGRIETLWYAGRRLQRAELCRQAQSLAWHRVLEARRNGGYTPAVESVGQFKCLGLFQGLAGVGYTFLRMALPEVVPYVLLLQRGTPMGVPESYRQQNELRSL
jgi:type 2 lantibiotic biosynthesis protein LanM